MRFPSWPDLARRGLRRWPGVEARALGALDVFYRLALVPFRRSSRGGSTGESSATVSRTDAFNEAAERYFAGIGDPRYLLDKPFGDVSQTPKHLIDAGVLIQALRLRRGDVVVELGAGSCWLSHMLNRCGCRTVSVDVSASALALGRTVFARDSRTDWALEPQFVAYDGHRLPLADGSCDRVVVSDAFHHVPNQRELLLEMRRVLRQDGLVAMSEPGRGHGSAEHSLREAGGTGVLENELVLQDVAALAASCGYGAAHVIVASPLANQEIPAHELGAFMGGRGFARYWKSFCSALEQHHYILLYRDSPRITTRRPGRLSALIEILRVTSGRYVGRDCSPAATQVGRDCSSPAEGPAPLVVSAGRTPILGLRIRNTGDTHWLSTESVDGGWTRVGAHLYTATQPRQVIDYDWCRADLPSDVPPGGQVDVTLHLPAIVSPGSCAVVIDLVVEGQTWFADRGSRAAAVGLHVD